MSPARDYSDYLNDILDAILKAQQFVDGVTYLEFAENDEKVFAVVRALEIIGEAAKQIPHPIREKYSEINWQAVAGMRDKLIHGYFVVSLPRIWETVTRDLPDLQNTIDRMIAELSKPPDLEP